MASSTESIYETLGVPVCFLKYTNHTSSAEAWCFFSPARHDSRSDAWKVGSISREENHEQLHGFDFIIGHSTGCCRFFVCFLRFLDPVPQDKCPLMALEPDMGMDVVE